MSLQMSHTTGSGATGDFWQISQISVDGMRAVASVIINLFIDSQDFIDGK